MYRLINDAIEFFLVHPGGPFWKNKDKGSWTIPKGEFADDEQPLSAARREFEEETGFAPEGKFIPLTAVKQKSGKLVHAWACEGNLDASKIISNTVTIEWPPKTNKKLTFPEVDRGEWFAIKDALEKINDAQKNFLRELIIILEKK